MLSVAGGDDGPARTVEGSSEFPSAAGVGMKKSELVESEGIFFSKSMCRLQVLPWPTSIR